MTNFIYRWLFYHLDSYFDLLASFTLNLLLGQPYSNVGDFKSRSDDSFELHRDIPPRYHLKILEN